MIIYNDKKVKEIIKKITKKKVEIKPIGNHHLKRHLVYHVKDVKGNDSVFKMYCKKNRWNREVSSLELLPKYNVLCPKLIDFGSLEDETEWVLLEHKKGKVLEKVIHEIDERDLYSIYEQMGEELGKIHSINVFNHFGNWGKNCENINGYKDLYSYMVAYIDSIFKELFKQDLPEKEIHKKGAELLRSQLDILKVKIKPRLCHNDFSERNILVYNKDDKWRLESVIDFEQSVPSDKDKELINIYFDLYNRNKNYAQAFRKGYEKYLAIDDEKLIEKRDFYRLYTGLCICSWAMKQAPDYYNEGLNLIKEYVECME